MSVEATATAPAPTSTPAAPSTPSSASTSSTGSSAASPAQPARRRSHVATELPSGNPSQVNADDYDTQDPDETQEPLGDEEPVDEDGDQPQNPEVDETQEPSISEELLERAEALGLSREEAAEYGDDKSLARALDLAERHASRSTTTPQKPQQQSQKTETETPAEEDIPDLDPENYDEPLVKAWGTMKKMVADLKQQNRMLMEDHQTRTRNEFGDWFYKQKIPGLGEEYKAHVENGGERKILDAMQTLADGHRARGQKVPPRDELFKQALAIAFSDKQQQIATKAVTEKVQKRSGQLLARPTNRSEKPPTSPEQQATRNVAAIMKKHGMEVADDNDAF